MKHTVVKEDLIRSCGDYVDNRISRIENGIGDLEEALKLETKCSMGDKYETGRAMLHLEFEKLSAQLEQYTRLKRTLSLIRVKYAGEKVGFGSAVKTSNVNYFISIPVGEVEAEGEKYFCVGANSPIAQALIGRKKGETMIFNGKEISILDFF